MKTKLSLDSVLDIISRSADYALDCMSLRVLIDTSNKKESENYIMYEGKKIPIDGLEFEAPHSKNENIHPESVVGDYGDIETIEIYDPTMHLQMDDGVLYQKWVSRISGNEKWEKV